MDVRKFVKTVASLFGNDAEGRQAEQRNLAHRGTTAPRPSETQYFPPPEEVEHTGSIKEAASEENSRFDEAVSKLAVERPRLVAGALELIGLDDVREALGQHWALLKDAVVKLSEEELRRALGPSDFFRKHGDASFLIHFDSLDPEAAELKARHIADQIKNKLAQSIPEVGRAISARPFVAVIDSTAIDPLESIADALFARLSSLRLDAVAEFQQRRKSLDQTTTILFSPIWCTQREVAPLHHCRASAFRNDHAPMLWQDLVPTEDAARIATEIDYLILTKALEGLHKLRRRNQAIPFLVPVDMRTLSSLKQRQEYIRLLSAAPAGYQNFIVLEVCRLDASVAADRVYEFVRELKPHVKELAVNLPLNDKRITEIAASGVWALSTDVADVNTLDRSAALTLSRFAAGDGFAGIKTIARGANTIGLAIAALEAGFSMIEGTAVGTPARDPRLDFRLRKQSLLSSKIGPKPTSPR